MPRGDGPACLPSSLSLSCPLLSLSLSYCSTSMHSSVSLLPPALTCPASVGSDGGASICAPTTPRVLQGSIKIQRPRRFGRNTLGHGRRPWDPAASGAPLAAGEGRQKAEQSRGTVSMGVEAAPVSSSSSLGSTPCAGLEPWWVCEEGPRCDATCQW